MTKPDQPKPIPLPLLLVYGKPTSPDLPQASWFRIEDRPSVTAAAQTLKISAITIATGADRALIAGVHERVLKGNGRMIVGSVSVEVYQRIEEHVGKAIGAVISPTNSNETEGAKSQEQTTNSHEKGSEMPLVAKAPPTAPTRSAETKPGGPAKVPAADYSFVSSHNLRRAGRAAGAASCPFGS